MSQHPCLTLGCRAKISSHICPHHLYTMGKIHIDRWIKSKWGKTKSSSLFPTQEACLFIANILSYRKQPIS